MTKIVAIGFDTVRKHPSLHRCFWAVRNDSLRDVEVLLDRNLCMIVCEVHRLKCPLSVLVGSLLNTWSSQFELFQCSVFGSCTCWFIIRDRSWAFVMAQCHFGSFDSFACLFFFSFRRIRSGYFGSAAVLRGRDCTVSFYRIRARCRLQSKLEPDRELRGRLAELKDSLCSGQKF